MTKPIVSVMIPAYNAASTIGRAVSSAAKQTIREIEILIVDDGSSDATADIVDTLSCMDPRIRAIRLERNGGQARARNVALSEARGVWAAPLDSDDAFHPERLQRLLDLANSCGADMAADNLRYVDGETNQPLEDGIIWSLEQECHLLTPAQFVRNNIYGENQFHLGMLQPMFSLDFVRSKNLIYNESLRVCPDFQFYQDCLVNGARYIISRDAYYYYYQYASSNSRKLTTADLEFQLALNRQAVRLAGDPEFASALEARGRSIRHAIEQRRLRDLVMAGRPIAAMRYLISNPAMWSFVASDVPGALRRRLGFAPAHWVPGPGKIDLH